jgi:hypothetical protein
VRSGWLKIRQGLKLPERKWEWRKETNGLYQSREPYAISLLRHFQSVNQLAGFVRSQCGAVKLCFSTIPAHGINDSTPLTLLLFVDDDGEDIEAGNEARYDKNPSLSEVAD